MAAVDRDEKCGYIDKKGNEVIKAGEYEKVSYYGDGIIPLYKSGVWYFWKSR